MAGMVKVRRIKVGRIKKLLALGIAVALSTFSLTGCAGMDWGTVSIYTDNAETAFNQVRDRNLEYIDLMEQQGFLSKSQADDWRSSVKTKMAVMLQVFKGEKKIQIDGAEFSAEELYSMLENAITKETVEQHKQGKEWYWNDGVIQEEPYKLAGSGCPEHSDFTVSPFTFYREVSCDEEGCDKVYWEVDECSRFETVGKAVSNYIDGKGKAFQLYDSAQVEQLKNALSRPIYVINNFDGADKSTERLQLALALLEDNRESAYHLMVDNGLGDMQVGDFTVSEMMVSSVNTLDTVVWDGLTVRDILTFGSKDSAIYDKAESDTDKVILDYVGKHNPVNRWNILNERLPFLNGKSIEDVMTRPRELSAKEREALEEYVLTYCEPVKDANGEAVTYLKVNTYKSGKRVDDDGTPYIFADTQYDEDRHIGTDTSNALNVLGKDVAIASDGKVSLLVRFMEFNPELIDQLKNNRDDTGKAVDNGRYYITDQTKKVAIKLDYPLYAVDSIKTDSVAGTDWRCTIAPTGMYMDLTDGGIYDREHNRIECKEPLYNSNSVAFWNYDTVDPMDENSDKVVDTVGEARIEVNVRPLVLKDYLELYYIREKSTDKGLYTEGTEAEYWTAIGRRMRIKKFEGGKDDIYKFAQSLEPDGRLRAGSNTISLTDIADITSGYGMNENRARQLGLGMSNSVEEDTEENPEDSVVNDGLLDDGQEEREERGAILGISMKFYQDEINPILGLGTKEEENGDDLVTPALAQLDSEKAYNLYGMCISKSLLDANLMDGAWIEVGSVASCENINWWNTWLDSNQFRYNIDIRNLLDMLNVTRDMLEEGGNTVITFDPGVLDVINTDLDKRQVGEMERALRTVIKLIGFVITLYPLLLMGAWMFDVNICAGPGLLKIFTFGKWEAVSDASDIPQIPNSDTSYMDLRSMMVYVVILMALGTLVMYVDFYSIRDMIARYLTPIVETVKRILIK